MTNVNMSVPKTIFEGNFGTYVFGKCFSFALSPAERGCGISLHLFFEKNY